ncbi:MAG: transglutaminase-like domain-containing protein, partial [Patescibacteria group bacterium]|nr:transglutaminase-like domain-containing protein [Patescibacteria group bacterium]
QCPLPHLDPVYKNNFEVISVKLPQGQTLNIERIYQIKRTPIDCSAGKFVLDDYKTSVALDKKYLLGNRLIKPELPWIKAVAAETRSKQKNLGGALSAVNEYVMKTLRYGNPQNGLYGVEEALRAAKVDCGGYDTLFASVCLALGIPVRVVSGFWLGYERNNMHAWLEAQLPDGRWLPADPSVEVLRRTGRSEKAGSLGYVGSDRAVYSYGCDIKLFDEKDDVTDILQVPFLLPKTEHVKVGISNKVVSTMAYEHVGRQF